MPFKSGTTNLYELDLHSDHTMHHYWHHYLHEGPTGNNTRNATDNEGKAVYIGPSHSLPQIYELSERRQTTGRWSGESSRNYASELDVHHSWRAELSTPEAENSRSELSERRQTTERRCVDSSMNDAHQIRSIEGSNRDKLVVSPVSLSSTSNRTVSPLSDSLVSPLSDSLVSPIAEVISEQTTTIGQSPNTVTQPLNPRHFQSRGLTNQRIDHHQTVPSQINQISELLPRSSRIKRDSSERVAIATMDLQQIRWHVDALNQEWKNQLIPQHGPDVRFSSTPFETGIQSLQEFYRGTLPRTFEEIFGMMHIAYACAWMYHKNDEPQFWRSFFVDVLRWHYAIATQEETLLFLEVAFQLWSVPECSITELAGYSNDFRSQLGCNLPEIYNEVGNTSHLFINYSQQSTPQAFDPSMSPSFMSPTHLEILDLLRLRDMLREGQVISLCTQHRLDGKLLRMEIILIYFELKICRFRLCQNLRR